jgi:hypothetical protein
MSKFKMLELVALNHDVAEHDLRAGNVGTIVEFWTPEALIVEFIEASGDTRAVLTLRADEVRKLQPHEVLAVQTA